MYRPEIFVGFDDSPAAAAALAWAETEATARGASLRAVHVLSWPYGAEGAPGQHRPSTHDEIDDVYRASITRSFDQSRPRPDWVLQFAEGDAGPVLVRLSQGASMLVLGCPEHTGLSRLLVGSVAHYCLSHRNGPLTCVPAGWKPDQAAESVAAKRQDR